jgi:hypothetical protein
LVRCTGERHDPCSAPCGIADPAEAISGCCAVGSAHPDPGSENAGRKHLRVSADLEPWAPDPTHQAGAGVWCAWVHQRRFSHLCSRPPWVHPGCGLASKDRIGARVRSGEQPPEPTLGCPGPPPSRARTRYFRERLRRKRGSARGFQYVCSKCVLKIT